MNIVTHNHSRNLWRDLSGQMDRFLNDPFGAVYPGDLQFSADGWLPAVDIKEEADRFVVRADVPGVDAKDIDVNVEDGLLCIAGKRESEVKDEKDGYCRVERSYGEFRRQFSLPATADANKVTAKSDKGVLEVIIGKSEVHKPKRITVKPS